MVSVLVNTLLMFNYELIESLPLVKISKYSTTVLTHG